MGVNDQPEISTLPSTYRLYLEGISNEIIRRIQVFRHDMNLDEKEHIDLNIEIVEAVELNEYLIPIFDELVSDFLTALSLFYDKIAQHCKLKNITTNETTSSGFLSFSIDMDDPYTQQFVKTRKVLTIVLSVSPDSMLKE